MEVTCQTDGCHSYMIIRNAEIDTDAYEVNMIHHNSIDGLLSFEFRNINENNMIYYRINGCVQIKQLIINGELEIRYIKLLMKNIIKLAEELNLYMLSPDNLIADINHVYYDTINHVFRFAYLPGYHKDIRKQIRVLTEECIKFTNHRKHEDVDFVYGIYDITVKQNYDIKEISAHMDFYSPKAECDIKNDNKAIYTDTAECDINRKLMIDALFQAEPKDVCSEKKSGMADDENRHHQKRNILNQENNDNLQTAYKKICIGSIVITGMVGLLIVLGQFRRMGHIETFKPLMGVLILMSAESFVYIQISKKDGDETKMEIPSYDCSNQCQSGEDTETTILKTGRQTGNKIKLMPCNGDANHAVEIDKPDFIIGRDKEKSDYIIDSRVVSRIHAKVCAEQDTLIIEDLSSANGTYINNCILKAGQKGMAKQGDIISFGNISYCVTIDNNETGI